MAALAGGRVNGFAPNADLCLVKTKGLYRHERSDRISVTLHSFKSLNFVLKKVQEHITQSITKDPGVKSVVNMSWGEYSCVRHHCSLLYI